MCKRELCELPPSTTASSVVISSSPPQLRHPPLPLPPSRPLRRSNSILPFRSVSPSRSRLNTISRCQLSLKICHVWLQDASFPFRTAMFDYQMPTFRLDLARWLGERRTGTIIRSTSATPWRQERGRIRQWRLSGWRWRWPSLLRRRSQGLGKAERELTIF